MHFRKINLLMLAAGLSTGLPAVADEASDQIKALTERIASLETEVRAGNKPLPVSINGFVSVGAGLVDSDEFVVDGLGGDPDYLNNSLLGVQLEADINARTRAVLQLLGRGSKEFAVSAEWAYVGIRVTEQAEIRVGRQRLPFFMLSEYLDVGYAYPWTRRPAEVYLGVTMPSTFDGVAWKHLLATESWSHDIQVFGGREDFPVAGGTFKLDKLLGVGVSSAHGNWTLTANFTRSSASLDQPDVNNFANPALIGTPAYLQPFKNDLTTFAGLGFQYDNGTLLVMGEATQIRSDSYYSDLDHRYLTVGYRLGKWMPHVTTGEAKPVDDKGKSTTNYTGLCAGAGICIPGTAFDLPPDTLARVLDYAQKSLTLGVRYDFLPNAALKMDVQRILDTSNTFGFGGRVDGNLFGAYPQDDIDVYRVSLDVVF